MRKVFPDPRDVPARMGAATPPHTVRPWPLPVTASPRVARLTERLAACGDATQLRATEAAVHAELAAERTPIWEPDDTPGWATVTFVVVAEAPHGMVIQLNRMTDPIDVADTLLRPLAGSRVHALSLRVPDTWLGGYLYVRLPGAPEVVLHQGVSPAALRPLLAAAIEDPTAAELVHNKHAVGDDAPRLAVARAPAAPALALWHDPPIPVRRAGTVASRADATELSLWTWSHPRADSGAPVLLLADGEVWRDQFPILPELARRVDADECAPMHVVFLDSGGPRQRQLDYPADVDESGPLLAEVRAAVADTVGTGEWIAVGQSLGGLFAMLCATRHPELIAAGVAQSPSLWWPAAPPPLRPVGGWFDERARTRTGSPILIHSGSYDWLVVDRTRDAAALLRAQDALIDYQEFAAGHDVLQWQATLPDAICRTLTHLADRSGGNP